MVPSGVRAVVFDVVGTLIHPEPPAPVVYAEVGRRFGSRLEMEEIRRRFSAAFRKEEAKDRQSGWRTSERREAERWRTIVSSVLDDINDVESCFCELFGHFTKPSSWRCVPDLASVLSHLASTGYTLAMASNYDSRLRTVIGGRTELASISQLVISSEVGWRKPAPEFFAAVGRQLDLAPEKILHVGDDPVNDYEGARDAGLHSLLITQENDVHAIASLIELTSGGVGGLSEKN